MNLRKTILVGIAALATISMATSASAAFYRHHHYRGYGAYAQYTGPGSMRFQNGSGWNNGRIDHNQRGRPDHW